MSRRALLIALAALGCTEAPRRANPCDLEGLPDPIACDIQTPATAENAHGEGGPCLTDSHCAVGFDCDPTAHRCRPTCQRDADCGQSNICTFAQPVCHAVCDAVQKVCRPACDRDEDCREGDVCGANHTCVSPASGPDANAPWPMPSHDGESTRRSAFVGAQKGWVKWAIRGEAVLHLVIAVGGDGNDDLIYVVTDQRLLAVTGAGAIRWSFAGDFAGLLFVGPEGNVVGFQSGRGIVSINQTGSRSRASR